MPSQSLRRTLPHEKNLLYAAFSFLALSAATFFTFANSCFTPPSSGTNALAFSKSANAASSSFNPIFATARLNNAFPFSTFVKPATSNAASADRKPSAKSPSLFATSAEFEFSEYRSASIAFFVSAGSLAKSGSSFKYRIPFWYFSRPKLRFLSSWKALVP